MRSYDRLAPTALFSLLMIAMISPLAGGKLPATKIKIVNGPDDALHFQSQSKGQFFIRSATFKSESNAHNYQLRLSKTLHYPVHIKTNNHFYSVVIGPIRTPAEVRAVGGSLATSKSVRSAPVHNYKTSYQVNNNANNLVSVHQNMPSHVAPVAPMRSSHNMNNQTHLNNNNQAQPIITSNEEARLIRREKRIRNRHRNLPYTATSLFAPIGYGPNWGVVYGVLMGVNRWPGGNASDGAIALGMGLGDTDRYVGGSINVLIDSLGLRSEAFGKNTAVGGSLSRWVTPNTSFTVGASVLGGTGAFKHTANGYYVSGTQLIPLTPNAHYHKPIAVTLGVGSGNFVSPEQMMIVQSDTKVSGFGAVSFSPIRQLSFIGDYTEQVLSLGVSVLPIRRFPMWITGYATNIAGAQTLPGPVTYGLRIGFAYLFV